MTGSPRISIRKILLYLYNHTEGFLLAVLGMMLVIDVLLGILSRYIHFDVVFATELGKYIFIWFSAIGISAAAKDNQHVRISYVADKLPVKRKVVWIFSQILFLVFALVFFYYGLQLTLMQWEMNKTAMGFNFPMYIFTAALPVGFGLTSFRLINSIITCLRNKDFKPWIMETPDTLTSSHMEE